MKPQTKQEFLKKYFINPVPTLKKLTFQELQILYWTGKYRLSTKSLASKMKINYVPYDSLKSLSDKGLIKKEFAKGQSYKLSAIGGSRDKTFKNDHYALTSKGISTLINSRTYHFKGDIKQLNKCYNSTFCQSIKVNNLKSFNLAFDNIFREDKELKEELKKKFLKNKVFYFKAWDGEYSSKPDTDLTWF